MGSVAGQQNFSGVTGRPVAKANVDQEANEASDHLITEGICPNFEHQNVVALVNPFG